METKTPLTDYFPGSERAAKAIAKIETKLHDIDSWNILIKEASSKNIEEVEGFYEELVTVFPTCGKYWKYYIEHESRSKRYDKVSELFKRSLEDVNNVDLYKCYINYIKESKSIQSELTFKAYRFAIDKVGIDPNALCIWNDYIQFLKERSVDSSYLDSQKITAIRKAYQEGIVNPMFHIDNLWKEYVSYEQSINPILAEKMTQDRSRDHMNSRRVVKEMEIAMRGLNRFWPAVPPTFSQDEMRQLELWRKYIKWEKSNPLRTENSLIILKRVTYAYKQFLLCFAHHPHVWYEYACYLDEQVKFMSDKGDIEMSKKLQKEENSLFEKATLGFMSKNLLIHFAHADFKEALNSPIERGKALSIYNKLIELGQQDRTVDITLVYIQLMRFVRRTEGIKSARSIFVRAKSDQNCGHQMYTAAALMENQCTKEQVTACKIFESGLKKFSDSPDYILSYIHFMNNLNEENNTRVLFERILTSCSLQPKDTIEIWNAFLQFESSIGDLSSINKVEKRRTAALDKILPKCTETSWAVDRYKFQDLYPCSIIELKSLKYDPRQSTSTPASLVQVSSLMDSSQFALSSNNANSVGKTNKRSRLSSQLHLDLNKAVKIENDLDTILDEDSLHYNHHNANDLDDDNSNGFDDSGICMPDLDQMLPFKPVISPAFGTHTVPGGVFPPPPAVGNLLARLPKNGAFWGPFVDIEELIGALRELDFNSLYKNFVDTHKDDSKPRTKRVRVD